MADPTALYSYRSQEPAPLPEKILLSDGRKRTDISSYTNEEIVDAGFTGPFIKPDFDSDIETQEWNIELCDWIISPIPDDVFWSKLRKIRNFELSNSDWTQLDDASLTNEKKLEWKNYRQELRDLPANTSNPRKIIWPLRP